jgi:hypothetical protein
MTADQDPATVAAGTQASPETSITVDARYAMGVAVGDGITQINYHYGAGPTWSDGVAAPPLVDVSGRIDSPYRGLSAFEERDAAFFFGRKTAADQILALMSRHCAGAGLLVVSGVSGAGKSSLLRAGVLPRLRGEGLASAPGSAGWPCLLFTPTRAPLDELAVRAAALARSDATTVRRELAADPAGFALAARQAALAAPTGGHATPMTESRLVLIIDQFEQLFTQCPDEQQRQAFITALHAACASGHGPGQRPSALAVLAVRADFEARCADYPELAAAVQDRYLMAPMSERQLRLAVTEPARKAGSVVESALVEELVEKVIRGTGPGPGSRAGVLPLLSYALDEAWRVAGRRAGDALTLADYESVGGIEGAVATSAQSAYDRLSARQQAAAREIFIRLTATSPDGTDVAGRAGQAELVAGKSPADASDVTAVLEEFAKERLLALAAGTVEISHEILLTAWPLLRDEWLAETHADRIVRTRFVIPRPSGQATPATRPTSMPAACWEPQRPAREGPQPTAPATYRSARANATSSTPAPAPAAGESGGGKASPHCLPPLPSPSQRSRSSPSSPARRRISGAISRLPGNWFLKAKALAGRIPGSPA